MEPRRHVDRGLADYAARYRLQSDEQQEQNYKRHVGTAKSEDLQTALDDPAAAKGARWVIVG